MSNKLAEQLLILLVMDLGYSEAPISGKHPIRHQLAWLYAMEELSETESTDDIRLMIMDMVEKTDF